MSPRRHSSFLTVTDLFCGAGGSSLGARKAGLEVRIASNHWKLAVETHATNFPDTDHDCANVSLVHPKRYPTTDLLIASPECTTHSPAGGSRRLSPQREMFAPAIDDEAAVRSRATAFDVVRFAEFHRYRCIIVENVTEFVSRWELFPDWLAMMHRLGYAHRVVSANSMHHHPTPQSRDRVYIVFWRSGNRAPDLDVRPKAFCPRCGKNVRARQAWKNGRTVGKYKQQYVYACPKCRSELNPYYFAALNAIDLSLPAERIGDRERPLRPRTMERIRFGLEKYGRRPLMVRTNMTTDSGRVRDLLSDPALTQTGSLLDAFVSPPPFLIDTTRTQERQSRPRSLDEPLPSQGTQLSAALVAPFLINAGSSGIAPRNTAEPMPALTCSERLGVVTPFVVANRANAKGRSLEHPLPAVCTGGHHMLVQGSALLTMRNSAGGYLFREVTDPLAAQLATCAQDAVISRTPYLVNYYGTGRASAIDEAVPSVPTVDRHALVTPGDQLDVDDCYFRMLQPHEIGRAMAFPDDYVVHGTRRDRVKQFGNAVTPPVMDFLIRRCVASLHPEAA